MLPWKPTSQATAGSMEDRICADDGTRVVSLWGERHCEALRSALQLALMEPHLRMRLPLWPVNSTGNTKLNRGNEHVSIL